MFRVYAKKAETFAVSHLVALFQKHAAIGLGTYHKTRP